MSAHPQQLTTTPKCSSRFVLLVLAVFSIALLSACLGSTPLSPAVILQALTASPELDDVLRQIILEFRLPRILTAALACAALATAGLMMQTIFLNPLADPFVLGINSGASLGVAIVILLLAPIGINLTESLSFSGQTLIVIASSTGAAATLMVTLSLSRKIDVMSLLIVGLMLSYAIGAIVSILMFFSMSERLQSFMNWSFGTYGNVTWSHMLVFAPSILVGLSITLLFMKPLDAMLLGEHYAESVGTRTKQVRFFILLSASILAGTVTGFCGPIGFLGIAAPHLSRYLFHTSNHRILIPATILVGALLSLSADLVARGPGLNISLPLNAITALIGAPVIIIALIKQRNMKRLFG